MFKTFLAHAFSSAPHLHLSPALQRLSLISPSDIAFTLLSLFALYSLLRLALLLLAPSTLTTTNSPHAAKQHQQQPSISRNPPDQGTAGPLSLLSLPLRPLQALWNMLIAPLVARPIPVPEPPTTLLDRALDAPQKLMKPESPWPVKQPYDAFLVLDVEATCQEGTDFSWPNEIIVRGVLHLSSTS